MLALLFARIFATPKSFILCFLDFGTRRLGNFCHFLLIFSLYQIHLTCNNDLNIPSNTTKRTQMATSTNISNPANVFIIEVNYTASLEVIDSIVSEHRAYLAKGYEAGFLLASGPRNPKTGGIIIGRFANLQEARDFTKNDPYYLKNAASYEIIEFSPVLFNERIKDFLDA